MRYNILYFCDPSFADSFERTISKKAELAEEVPGEPVKKFIIGKSVGSTFEITLYHESHSLLRYMTHKPIDLLIIDERRVFYPEDKSKDSQPVPQKKRFDALTLLQTLRKQMPDVVSDLGLGFRFPMSRIAVIIDDDDEDLIFKLAQLDIRRLFVNPRKLLVIINWIIRTLVPRGVEQKKSNLGVCFSGGGVEGYLYQMGCLLALEKILCDGGLHKARCIYGVSSGAISGSILAAPCNIKEIVKSIFNTSKVYDPLVSSTIFDFAGTDIIQHWFGNIFSLKSISVSRIRQLILENIPAGLIKGKKLESYISNALKKSDCKDRINQTAIPVLIGATDQDRFNHVVFGAPPWDDLALSEAVRASIALPPFFLPKKIGNDYFMDGQVTKTTDIDIMIERGCKLILIINPLKPFPSQISGSTKRKGGYYTMIQTIKALVSTRFEDSLKHLMERFPKVDFVVLEPDENCAELMRGSPMRYHIRTEIIEEAYKSSIRQFMKSHHYYDNLFAKHRIKILNKSSLSQLKFPEDIKSKD